MLKNNKKSKVKGYGAYWTGDIRNKHIARKNKQYIRDQKYLHIYKKIKASEEGQDSSQKSDHVSHDSHNFENHHSEVNVIRPEVETTYLSHSDDDIVDHSIPENPYSLDDGRYDLEKSTNSKVGKGNVYSKVLKKRKELEKQKKEEHEKRIEEVKKRKNEIREKKQKRYARHRLLGVKTKKGQPIMKNVIKHLMRNFKPD